MIDDAITDPAASTINPVHGAIATARDAIECARNKPGPYGAPVNIDEAAKRAEAALDALEAEAAKEDSDVRQLGKHMQALSDGASWLGSRLGVIAEFQAAASSLQAAVISQQTDVATRGLTAGARHLVLTDMTGRKAYYDIRDQDTLRSVAQQAAVREIAMEEADGPPDISGLAPAQRKLYETAVRNGWNVQLTRGANSADEPIECVHAFHPGTGETAQQTYIGGKRAHYGAEPVKQSMARIEAKPRGEYAGQPDALPAAPDLEAEA
jgi:hypothetical protein